MRRLISYLGSFTACDDQSPIPFRGHAGPPAPHNGLQPCLDQRDDGLGIEPSERHPSGPAGPGTDQPAGCRRTSRNQRRFPAAVPVPAPHRSARWRAGMSGLGRSGRSASRNAVAAGPDARTRPTKRSARSRAAPSLAS